MAKTFGQSAPDDKPREKPEARSLPAEPQVTPIPRLRPNRFGAVVLVAATLMGLFWIGVGLLFIAVMHVRSAPAPSPAESAPAHRT